MSLNKNYCCHFGTYFCPVGLGTLVAVIFVEAFMETEFCYVLAFAIVILALPVERSLEKQFQTLPSGKLQSGLRQLLVGLIG